MPRNKKDNNKEVQNNENKNNSSLSISDGVIERSIVEEMKESYLAYAMSVIVSRALPDVRDGLKPVHRRILYVMHEDGITSNAKFRKSANVVGSTLGRYHPHGDQAVYDAAIRMSQPFSLRYPLIQGQGNIGSIDDPSEYAAMRYTEMRLSKIGEEMLRDIEKNTVDFMENYDGTRKEPVVLPSPIPNLLINGSLGIAVGMATNIPPHNLSEVVDACCYYIDNPDCKTEDLFQFIQGPDFPLGGAIFNKKEIIQAYSQGRGPIIMRGDINVEEDKKGKIRLVITSIPYQVQKSTLMEQFAKLIQDKKLVGIKDIRDESDKEGMRIVIELQRDAFPKKVINQLYKFTDLQKIYHLNMLALVDGIQPQVLSLVDVIKYYIEHREKVIYRRTEYELEKARNRAHILDGLHRCLGNIDEVIRIIKGSKDREDAKTKLMKRFRLTEIQANAILDTKLASLAKLERKKIEDELKMLRAQIKELEAILKSDKKVKEIVKKELLEIKQKYGDERRTKVFVHGIGEFSEEDLIPDEETIITITRGGYIKRVNPKVYKEQKRGGKGVIGMQTMGEDVVEHFLYARTHDSILFFTDSGKVFQVKAYEIPEGQRLSKGRGITNFLEISQNEKILSLLTLSKYDIERGFKFIAMATEKGLAKKTPLDDFKNVRRSGLTAITLKKGDSLVSAKKTTGDDSIMLITQNGQSIHFKEKDIRSMGRQASGVTGIRLRENDKVVSMEVINKEWQKGDILLISENGYGKRVKISLFKIQKRGGSGIKIMTTTQKTGKIVSSHIIYEQEHLIAISEKGQVIKTDIKNISQFGRQAQGVRIMKLDKDDKVASFDCV